MTKTQYYTATTIDGFIADEANSLEWLFEVDRGDTGTDRFSDFFTDVGAMVMGATTYQWVLQHERLLDDPSRWRHWYGDRPCWVFTHRELPPVPGAEITFVRDDVQQVHQRMTEAAGGRNIWVVGGGDLAGQFADRGLLDEIQLGVAPVTLGAGAPVLPRRLLSAYLNLSAVHRDGQMVHLVYQVRHR